MKAMTARSMAAAGAVALAMGGAFAQSAGTGSFLRDQAVAEMQRVSAQVDVLASNHENLSARVRKCESVNDEIASLRAEVAALKGTVAELRRAMERQREEIVRDLSKKIASMQPPPPPPPPKGQSSSATPKPRQAYSGPCYEYTVQPGDTLSLIAKAFNSSVQKIKDVNGLRSDALKVGQKINVPKE